jgi:hypothetical protein
MVKFAIAQQALGQHTDHIEPIVNGIIHGWVDVLYKKSKVSKIVGDILDNKDLNKWKEVPLFRISLKLQHFISAIRVVYAKEIRREVLGRFVPTLLNMINEDLKHYGLSMHLSDKQRVIDSQTKIKLIQVSPKKRGNKKTKQQNKV